MYTLTQRSPDRSSPSQLRPCLPSRGGRAPSAEHEVATIQHDGDKIVFAARSGILRVVWLGELPDEGMPFGVYNDGRPVQSTSLKPFMSPPPGNASSQQESVPTANLSPGIGTDVRLYVSTVVFRGDALVTDGFDNQVLNLRFGEADH